MNSSEILSIFNEIFINELENKKIILTRETTANDIEEWDSLNHVLLIVAIEKRFKVRFTTKEIQTFKNVGEMCDAVEKKSHL